MKKQLSFVAAAAALMASSAARAQDGPFEYAAKFLCGPTGHIIQVVQGNYLTAINVHNPRDDNEFRWKVAVAGSGAGGPISKFDSIKLANDQAVDIDCSLIRKRLSASGIVPPPFLYTGFVVIQTKLPLDVVAVYTAAPVGGQVATLHTERVPPRPMR